MRFWQRGDGHAIVRAKMASLLKIRVDRQTVTNISDGGGAFILWAMQSRKAYDLPKRRQISTNRHGLTSQNTRIFKEEVSALYGNIAVYFRKIRIT
jgi:hypothetical protein